MVCPSVTSLREAVDHARRHEVASLAGGTVSAMSFTPVPARAAVCSSRTELPWVAVLKASRHVRPRSCLENFRWSRRRSGCLGRRGQVCCSASSRVGGLARPTLVIRGSSACELRDSSAVAHRCKWRGTDCAAGDAGYFVATCAVGSFADRSDRFVGQLETPDLQRRPCWKNVVENAAQDVPPCV